MEKNKLKLECNMIMVRIIFVNNTELVEIYRTTDIGSVRNIIRNKYKNIKKIRYEIIEEIQNG